MKNPSEACAREGSESGPDSLPLEGPSVSGARVDAWRDGAKADCVQSIFRSSVHAPLCFSVHARGKPRARDAAFTLDEFRCQAAMSTFVRVLPGIAAAEPARVAASQH